MTPAEPVPPPRETHEGRALHTSLQLPAESRASRSSSIILSVVVHILLIVGIRQWVWKPVTSNDDDGPVFQVFQLDAIPEPTPPPIHTPDIEPITPQDPQVERRTPPIAMPAAQADVVASPGLVQPNEIPRDIPPPGAAIAEPTTSSKVPPPRNAAERLLRTGISPSLVPARPGAIPSAVTPQEAAAARMYAGMKEYNDSVAGAIADAERATDWTKKGKNGERWGVSPGQIHLGSITIPMPFAFSGPTGRREETAGRLRSFAEANAQAKRVETEQTFESRVKAMRARKDAQRDSARASTIGQ